jgi:hypothetical protein
MGHAIGLGHGDGVMDENLLSGVRSTPELWLEAPAAAATKSAEPARNRTAPPAAARAPKIAFDWNARTLPPIHDVPADDADRANDWQTQFVNSLGVRDEETNPNAGLSIRVAGPGDDADDPDRL